MLWSRKPTSPTHEKARHAGIDLTASRVRASTTAAGKSRALLLDDPSEELPLYIALDRRAPDVGRAGCALYRKAPHYVCSNFLPALAQPREWRGGRHVLSPESALDVALARVRGPVVAESEAAALALPAYLAPNQVAKVVAAATRVKLPLKGTAVGALALVADRAGAVIAGRPAAP